MAVITPRYGTANSSLRIECDPLKTPSISFLAGWLIQASADGTAMMNLFPKHDGQFVCRGYRLQSK